MARDHTGLGEFRNPLVEGGAGDRVLDHLPKKLGLKPRPYRTAFFFS